MQSAEPVLPDGAGCSTNGDCGSGVCAWYSRDSMPVGLIANRTFLATNQTFVKACALTLQILSLDGAKCSTNSDCQSGVCAYVDSLSQSIGANQTFPKACAKKPSARSPGGAICTTNSDCASGVCAWDQSPLDRNQTCVDVARVADDQAGSTEATLVPTTAAAATNQPATATAAVAGAAGSQSAGPRTSGPASTPTTFHRAPATPTPSAHDTEQARGTGQANTAVATAAMAVAGVLACMACVLVGAIGRSYGKMHGRSVRLGKHRRFENSADAGHHADVQHDTPSMGVTAFDHYRPDHGTAPDLSDGIVCAPPDILATPPNPQLHNPGRFGPGWLLDTSSSDTGTSHVATPPWTQGANNGLDSSVLVINPVFDPSLELLDAFSVAITRDTHTLLDTGITHDQDLEGGVGVGGGGGICDVVSNELGGRAGAGCAVQALPFPAEDLDQLWHAHAHTQSTSPRNTHTHTHTQRVGGAHGRQGTERKDHHHNPYPRPPERRHRTHIPPPNIGKPLPQSSVGVGVGWPASKARGLEPGEERGRRRAVLPAAPSGSGTLPPLYIADRPTSEAHRRRNGKEPAAPLLHGDDGLFPDLDLPLTLEPEHAVDGSHPGHGASPRRGSLAANSDGGSDEGVVHDVALPATSQPAYMAVARTADGWEPWVLELSVKHRNRLVEKLGKCGAPARQHEPRPPALQHTRTPTLQDRLGHISVPLHTHRVHRVPPRATRPNLLGLRGPGSASAAQRGVWRGMRGCSNTDDRLVAQWSGGGCVDAQSLMIG